jgi:probable phosphoglycerate mutase
VAGALGLGTPESVPELVERNYGSAEGLTGHEITRLYPGSMPVPGRETREEVASRVMPALLRIAAAGAHRRVIVATHGAVIRTVLLAVNASVDRSIPITNGSVHSFQLIGESLKLIEFDDPIELDSVVSGDEGFDEQNVLENREDKETQ